VPLRFDPALEHPEAGEETVGKSIQATMETIREKTFADGGHAIRSVHAKSHGLLQGRLEVYGDLAPVLAQGLFAKPADYPVVMRISTIPGDVLDDAVSTPRGLAIKVIGVVGERLPGTEGQVTQDFVLVNGPAFNSPNGKAFAANLKLLAATTDRIEGVKKVLSSALQGVESLIESAGVVSPTLTALGGQAETNVLGETYYSQAPLLYGPYIVKLSVAPLSPGLKALAKAPVNLKGKPNGLREAVVEFFAAQGGEWEVRVQFAIDHEHTPIEDAHKIWPEDRTPFIPVGKIIAPPQTAWSEARSAVVDDGMSFSPWHALAAHRPLGSVMRLRKAAYEQSAAFRAAKTGRPVIEPIAALDLP
jgi:hypothetical protein